MAATVTRIPSTGDAAKPKRFVSADDYYSLPEDSPRCELVEGVLRMVPSPEFEHQNAALELAVLLRGFVMGSNLGRIAIAPLDVRLSDTTVVQPDILLLPPDHPQVTSGKGRITVPPSLVVEVLSPGSIRTDRSDKFRLYQQAKIPFYWIVDPAARRIEAWVLVEGQYDLQVVAQAPDSFTAPPFADLVIDLKQVFGDSTAS